MAFGDTRNAAFNKNIQRMLDYFLDQKLMKQRYGMETGLQEQQQAGRLELESTENKNLQDRMWKGWIYQISRDPEISALQSDIFVDKKAGLNTSKKEMDLGDIVSNRGQAALKAVKGTLTDSDMNQIMRLSDTTARTLLSEYGATTRQTEQITKIGEPGIRQRQEEIGLRGQELGVRRGELKAKGQEQVGKLSDQEKATISLIGDTKKFLIGEGVKPAKDYGPIRDMLASGKILDPLSPENRGMALQWLNALEFKVINRKPLTPNDERFMTTVMNTSGIEPTTPAGEITTVVPGRPTPGGLVSPETGLTTGEDQKINTVVEQKVKDRMYNLIYQGFKNRGFSDEAAAFHARNLLTQMK